MNKEVKKASHINIISNIILFIINLIVGLVFSSLSFISKAFESVHDILTAIIIHFTIKINNKDADESHPFGHSRAENIAGYTIGILMIILAISVIKEAITSLFLFNGTEVSFSHFLIYAALIGFTVKLILYIYIKNVLVNNTSAALKANMQDHLNDVLMYIGILIAGVSVYYGLFFVDSIVGLIIGIIIFKSGFDIVRENIDFLMGSSANKRIINQIRAVAFGVDGVLGVNTIKTQYLGSEIQAEVHIELNSKLNLKKSHDIGKEVKYAIENIDSICDCFVHIDVFEDKTL